MSTWPCKNITHSNSLCHHHHHHHHHHNHPHYTLLCSEAATFLFCSLFGSLKFNEYLLFFTLVQLKSKKQKAKGKKQKARKWKKKEDQILGFVVYSVFSNSATERERASERDRERERERVRERQRERRASERDPIEIRQRKKLALLFVCSLPKRRKFRKPGNPPLLSPFFLCTFPLLLSEVWFRSLSSLHLSVQTIANLTYIWNGFLSSGFLSIFYFYFYSVSLGSWVIPWNNGFRLFSAVLPFKPFLVLCLCFLKSIFDLETMDFRFSSVAFTYELFLVLCLCSWNQEYWARNSDFRFSFGSLISNCVLFNAHKSREIDPLTIEVLFFWTLALLLFLFFNSDKNYNFKTMVLFYFPESSVLYSAARPVTLFWFCLIVGFKGDERMPFLTWWLGIIISVILWIHWLCIS